ncbi:cytochrome b/b6 domain-containing protein [Bathymodiolus thermophilus thioautotrophic gill symbiont]|uniref:cytochrome b/b6 domain-containing protein n=1 Tax=Bathymodiolus thermophilus thioautotrophic gill symbiont TaxID=2360 RepID=UPI000F07ABC4|nr:cytochrome b/b6 domain-containing protein [Bathymodiolus thermophilus thioautotrophic gill symbiont]
MSQVTSGANENDIKVWDVLIRIFHWSLVVSFFIAYVPEEESLWHIYSGYTVLALIIFRMIWGIVGSKYAQFSSFSYSPINALSYLKEWVDGKPKRYIGHNPAGGLMVIALLASLFVVTISGLKIYAIEEGKGPLSGNGISIIANAYADDDEHKNNKHKKTPA